MKEQLITFDTAKLAKEKVFETILNSYYDTKTEKLIHNKVYVSKTLKSATGTPYGQNTLDDYEARLGEMDNSLDEFILAPTQSLLQKWLREEHNIFVSVDVNYCYKIYHNDELFKESTDHHTYEEALEVGLKEALKLI